MFRSPEAKASKSLADAINLLATPVLSEHDFKRTLRRSDKALLTNTLSTFIAFQEALYQVFLDLFR